MLAVCLCQVKCEQVKKIYWGMIGDDGRAVGREGGRECMQGTRDKAKRKGKEMRGKKK